MFRTIAKLSDHSPILVEFNDATRMFRFRDTSAKKVNLEEYTFSDLRYLLEHEKNTFSSHPKFESGAVKGKEIYETRSAPKKIDLKFPSLGEEKWNLNFEPGTFLGKGASGSVFTLRNFNGYVMKIVPLDRTTKGHFLREVSTSITMGEAGIGPGVESFWINDEPQKFPPFVFAPMGCGYMISRRMDMTLFQFKKKYKISQGDGNYNKLMEFSKKLKEVTWEKGIRISDLGDENIMLNVSEDGAISDVRIVDFGTVFLLETNKTPLLSLRTDDPALESTIEDVTRFKKIINWEIENLERQFES